MEKEPRPITYSDGKTVVQLGDRVKARMFFVMKRAGRVSYVPGVSPVHAEMEHDGIRLVGVNFDGGGSGGFWVDPSTSAVVKSVTLVARDSSPMAGLPPPELW